MTAMREARALMHDHCNGRVTTYESGDRVAFQCAAEQPEIFATAVIEPR
jgi:hypothetical protein